MKRACIYLVDDRDDSELGLESQIEIGHRLGLNPL